MFKDSGSTEIRLQERKFEEDMRNMGKAHERNMQPKSREHSRAENLQLLFGLIAVAAFLGLAVMIFGFLGGF